ncbi:MAG: hypothetical protein K0Q49_1344 [Haloplasmataceae bacterium]|jgi:bifunctional DNA-binding transcriptional regulator/antitoxin component of YhaV-PrlF toxin-antitoxin module|nr:hypothetical protein [Haloplasmataceae bacterium]
MDKIYAFKAIIHGVENLDGAYIKFPYNVKEEFGSNGIIKVVATFDGFKYRGILAKMSDDCHIIGITKAIRNEIGKGPGNEIEVTLEQSEENRLDDIPFILIDALNNNSTAKAFFDTLTDSQKNKFSHFINSAKKAETINNRIDKVIEMLNHKEKMK